MAGGRLIWVTVDEARQLAASAACLQNVQLPQQVQAAINALSEPLLLRFVHKTGSKSRYGVFQPHQSCTALPGEP